MGVFFHENMIEIMNEIRKSVPSSSNITFGELTLDSSYDQMSKLLSH